MNKIFSRLYADKENDQITVYYDNARVLFVFESRDEEATLLPIGSTENRDQILADIHNAFTADGYEQLTKDKDIGGLTDIIEKMMDEKEDKSVSLESPQKQKSSQTFHDMPEAEATAAMPAPDYSGMSHKDIMTAYHDTANYGLVPLITEGLTEGLKVYKAAVKAGEAEDTNVSVEMNADYGVMSFYYGEDDCEGEPFFRHNIGVTLKICAAMLKAADANSRQSLSNWFEDAVPNISKNVLKGLEITLWVPDVGGDPYLEL